MTTIRDDFNRSDQTNLGAATLSSVSQGWSWSSGDLEVSGAGRMDIVSNQAKQLSGAVLCSVRAETDLASNDNYAQASIYVWGTELQDGSGVCCRMSGGTGPSFYMAYLFNPTGGVGNERVLLYKNTGAQNFVQLGSNEPVSVSLPDTLKIEAVGTAIKTYFNGTQCTNASASDSAVTTGKRAGFRLGGGGAAARIHDDFEAGDVGGGGGPAGKPWNHYSQMRRMA
jgi:hypothetical protein